MTLSLELTPEVEKGLTAQAHRLGVSLADYLQEILIRQADLANAPCTTNGNPVELPLLHLGVVGPIHRREIYDDVR